MTSSPAETAELVSDPLSDLEARTRALLASRTVSAPTRKALVRRMDQTFGPSSLFSVEQRRTMEAVCLRLIPEPDLVRRIRLAAAFEAKLGSGLGRGWRYIDMQDDVALHQAGLTALDGSARAEGGSSFADLPLDAQDELLQAAADGKAPMADPVLEHWFEELLAALAEIYYAHPLVQVSIGYDGMADALGVEAVGLDAVAAEAEHLER